MPTPRLATAVLMSASLACGSGGGGGTTQADAGGGGGGPDAGLLAAGCARSAGALPVWTEGRYFPRMATPSHVYAFTATTPLGDGSSWNRDWRVSASPATMNALTLVGMQGVINRETPCVFLDWANPLTPVNAFWRDQLAKHATVENVAARDAAAVAFLYARFADRFTGAVIYDPAVPDTINVATMLAGLENRLILAPSQVGQAGIPAFADTTDLRMLASSGGWDTTEAGKTRLYQWVYDNLWPRLERRMVGIVSPGPPTSLHIPGTDDATFYPLGIAARDYLIALRAPVLWLHPTDGAQRALLDRFLRDAPSPIPVTGVYDEFSMLSFVSEHGDWDAAFTWPNAPLTGGNLTVLGAGEPPPRAWAPAIDEARVLSTLSASAATTIFYSDGDNLGYQLDRGFYSVDPSYAHNWPQLQGHRLGWTQNPTLIDLSPLAWSSYVDSADKATMIAGFAGAGYAFPQLMSPAQLGVYLDRSAEYLTRTGLRTVAVYTGFVGPNQQVDFASIARPYHEKLKGSGYLGALVSVGRAVWGLGVDWDGVPSPAISPMAYTSIPQILADLPARKLGDFTISLVDWPAQRQNLGEVVDDAKAPGGQAVRYPSTQSGLVFATGPQNLLAGNYQATYALAVSANGSSAEIAAIGVADAVGTLAQRRLRASDFAAAGEWQTFTISFKLPARDPEVNILIEMFPGVADLRAATVRVTREGRDALPVVAPIFSFTVGGSRLELAKLGEHLEAKGVAVLTADELMASMNPDYMIALAERRLGAGHAEVVRARGQLAAGQFLDALLTARTALSMP